MTIQFNPDTLDVVVDHDTYRRFNQGTDFQQYMNMLVILEQLLIDSQKEMLDKLNLTPEQYQQALKKMDNVRKTFLRFNPPPDIDPDALRFYCD
jgi:hypothetical protein